MNELRTVVLVFLGGGFGSICRYLLGKIPGNSSFPLSTFLVNILACLVLGILAGIASSRPELASDIRTFGIIGFCGGFSTFSAFSYQNLELIQAGQSLTAIFYT